MPSPSTMQDRYPYHDQLNWSKSERLIARRAFDAALKRELHEIIQQAKRKASQITEPADVWELDPSTSSELVEENHETRKNH